MLRAKSTIFTGGIGNPVHRDRRAWRRGARYAAGVRRALAALAARSSRSCGWRSTAPAMAAGRPSLVTASRALKAGGGRVRTRKRRSARLHGVAARLRRRAGSGCGRRHRVIRRRTARRSVIVGLALRRQNCRCGRGIGVLLLRQSV